MFKKIFSILILGVIALLILPSVVNADIYQNGDKKYEFKSIPTACSLNDNAVVDKVSSTLKEMVLIDYNFDTTNKNEYYTLDKNGVCTQMKPQQILDYLNEKNYYYNVDLENNFKKIESVYLEVGFLNAAGTTYSPTQRYYTLTESQTYAYVSSPREEDLDNYYIGLLLFRPTEAAIDDNITYYTKSNSDILTKVLNPIVEDIHLYYYQDANREAQNPYEGENVTLKTITSPVIIEKLNDDDLNKIFLSYENDQYIVILDREYNAVIYDINGNLINNIIDPELELVNIEYINSLFFITYYDNSTNAYLAKIVDLDGNVLFTKNDLVIDYYYFIDNDNNLLMFNGYDGYGNSSVYLIKEYKLLTQDNLTYDNNDLSFRFSGEYEDVKSVKINDQVLNSDDYTLTKGSTIVTLKNKYLKTLSKGDYVLKVAYKNDIELTSSFKIKNDPIENPETSDKIINYIIFGIISVIGLFGILLYFKRKNNCFGNN